MKMSRDNGDKIKGRLSKKIRLIIGFSLLTAALTLIGVSVWSIVSANIAIDESLREAEQMVAEFGGQGEENPPVIIDGTDGTASPLAPESATPTASAPEQSQNISSAKPASSLIGILVFESLGGRKVPVRQGAAPQELNHGAGHNERTSSPGVPGNCLVYGHRDTVFRGFGKLQLGDTIRFETPSGTYVYKITSMSVVDPGDPIIFHVYEKAVLTLVTCYPFDYIGHAPQRYVVVATIVS